MSGFPNQNLIVGWILRTVAIPNINPHQIMKTVQALTKQAITKKEEKKVVAPISEAKKVELEKVPQSELKRPTVTGWVKEDGMKSVQELEEEKRQAFQERMKSKKLKIYAPNKVEMKKDLEKLLKEADEKQKELDKAKKEEKHKQHERLIQKEQDFNDGKIGNKERILELLKKNALISKEIASELNLSEKNTRTYLMRLKKEDKITDIGKTGRFLIYTHKEALTPRNQHDEIVALEGDLSYLLSLIELKMTPKDGVKFTPSDLMNIRRIEERIAYTTGISSKTRDAIKDLIDFERTFKEEINEKITKLEQKVDFITSHNVKSIEDKKFLSDSENLLVSNEQTSISKELLICDVCGAKLSHDFMFCSKCGNKLRKNQKMNKLFQKAQDYDFLFKSIVVGDWGVGKTTLMHRFSKVLSTEDGILRIGVDFHMKTISIDTSAGPLKCKLQIWDTGGQERFSSIRPMYYRNSLGAVIVFDLTNYESFKHLPEWIEEVLASIKDEIPVLLVGNKSDLIDQRAVSKEEISKLTKDFNMYYIETSAKTGDGVDDCFYVLACLMIGQGVPKHMIANRTIYAPGEIHLRRSQISAYANRFKEPQVAYSAPFAILRKEEPSRPQPIFGVLKPSLEPQSNMFGVQTVETKKAKEKKKQDRKKAKIEEKNKTSISLEDEKIFTPKKDRVDCENCGYKIVVPFPKDQLCPKCGRFLTNLFKYVNNTDFMAEELHPKVFKPQIVTASSKMQGVRKKEKTTAISLDDDKINLKGGNEYIKFCGITSVERTPLFATNNRLVFLLELTNNLDFIATSILGGDLDKMVLKTEEGETEKCQFFEKDGIIYLIYGTFPDKKGRWVLEQMAKFFSELVFGKNVNNLSKLDKYNIEKKFKGNLLFIFREYMQLEDVFSDQEIPYVEDWLRLDYIGLSSMSIGVISILLDTEEKLNVKVPGDLEDLAEEIEMKESLLTAKIEAIAANTLGNTGAYPRWIAVKLGFQQYRFLTFKKYPNDYFLSCLTEGNLQKIDKIEALLEPILYPGIDTPFSGNLRSFNKIKNSIKEIITQSPGRKYT